MQIVMLILVLVGFYVVLQLIQASIGWVIALVIWGFTGWIASQIMSTRLTIIQNILLGLVGGFVGSITLGLLGIGLGNVWLIGNILVGVVGGVISIALWRLVNKS